MASDGDAGGRNAGKTSASAGFFWVSSSPSPADIARLETVFPEVVSVPADDLKLEMADWLEHAVIARSFLKWIPAEAFVREFRRAGIQGEIKPISLAFRCHIFRFEDPTAADLVLNRPWVINGQIIGMDRWKPEFVPSAEAIPCAQVWLRLPNLPLEFWTEDFLRAITESAGQFLCVDASTLARSRGGFARVCLRVDFRRPLRPGTRVQGINLPFWQQFVYEFLEGFCPNCGSIHLEGPCSEPSGASKEEDGSSPAFGSWLTAVRQRRDGPGFKREERKKPISKAASVVLGREPASQMKQEKARSGDGTSEGWCVPVKVARRTVAPLTKMKAMAEHGVIGSGGEKEKEMNLSPSDAVTVPVTVTRAGSAFAEKTRMLGKQKGSAEAAANQVMPISNPFAYLEVDLGCSNVKGSGDAFPGPLKRPRSVDCPAPRTISKSGKKKGKGKAPLVKSIESTHYSPTNLSLPPCPHDADKEMSKPSSARNVGLTVADPAQDSMDRPFDSLSSALTLRLATVGGDSEGQMVESSMMTDGGTLASECLPDMIMAEDQGGVPDSSSSK